MKLMEFVWKLLLDRGLTDFTEDDLHRIDGTLLGYSKADIEAFIKHVHARQKS